MTSARLPDVAATHFDVRGEPNALSSRDSYRGFMALLIVVIPLVIAGLPAVLARRWPQLLNIPNRKHWLTPERIEDTLSSLRARMALLAVAAIGLQCLVHRLVLAANAADRAETRTADAAHRAWGLRGLPDRLDRVPLSPFPTNVTQA